MLSTKIEDRIGRAATEAMWDRKERVGTVTVHASGRSGCWEVEVNGDRWISITADEKDSDQRIRDAVEAELDRLGTN